MLHAAVLQAQRKISRVPETKLEAPIAQRLPIPPPASTLQVFQFIQRSSRARQRAGLRQGLRTQACRTND
jgi:hypothetical protein